MEKSIVRLRVDVAFVGRGVVAGSFSSIPSAQTHCSVKIANIDLEVGF